MRVRLFLFATATCLTAAALSAPCRAVDVKTVAAGVDAHYNHLHSLEAEFTEVYRGSGMDRTESGTLWLKKPGKMRWEYRSPKDKLFVSNGKDAWFYVPEDRQARKTDAKKLEDIRSPLAFLLGKTKLEKELQGLSLAPDVPPLQPGNMVSAWGATGVGGSSKRNSPGDHARKPDRAHRHPGSGWSHYRLSF